MKKVSYGIYTILLLCILVACRENDNPTGKNNENKYVTLVRYNGECYHYNQADTLIMPEKEVGEIKTLTETIGELPTEDWQVNAGEEWLGTKIYVNEKEDAIYIKSKGSTVYECYVKGEKKISEEADGLYNAYVTYQGKLWILMDEKEKIAEDFKDKEMIHSFGAYYIDRDYSTNLPELLGGNIYISKDTDSIIFVEATDGRIWVAEPDKNEYE